uniref:Adhesin domain-containing protein n=1 Tax=Glossina brevipalpis TaxID=37001 RepID=A0A1A9W9P8_9MUSC
MIILRQTAPLFQYLTIIKRFYASKKFPPTMNQIHQETLRFIDPQAHIIVLSDIYTKIRSADVHAFPDGNAFISELHGGPLRNCTASMDVKISDDEKQVEVVIKKIAPESDFHCELAVPIRAAVTVDSRHGASVKNIFGRAVRVKANKFINVRDVRAEFIHLESEGENISCLGLLLGKETLIETNGKGNITLDKLQGDRCTCKTVEGNINTNCSYVEFSKFETSSGSLFLKNIHKHTEVAVNQKGKLNMLGVHGNLRVHCKGGLMNIQLSELCGDNVIRTENMESAVVNISDVIENNANIEACIQNDVSIISLDDSLRHLTPGLNENKQNFKWNSEKSAETILKIYCKNEVTLGKSSWMDMTTLHMMPGKQKRITEDH